jgi:hypothetical protein
MITYNELRNQSSFGSYVSINSAVDNLGNTVYNEFGTAGDTAYGITSSNSSAFTSFSCYSLSSADGPDGASSTVFPGIGYSFVDSYSSTTSSQINITSNVDTTTSQWTVSGYTGTLSSGQSYLTTHAVSTTAVSNQSSSVGGVGSGTFAVNQDITSSISYSFLGTTTNFSSFNVPQEFGTVAIAESFDWLWSFNSLGTTNFNYSLLTSIASSFTQETFWPLYSTSIAPYVGTDTETIAADTFSYANGTFNLEFLTAASTSTISITSGSNFPRDTYSTTVSVWTTSSSSSSYGGTYAIEDYATFAVIQSTLIPTPATVFATYPFGLSDALTTSLLSTVNVSTTTTTAQAASVFITEEDEGITEVGTVEQTVLINLGPVFSALSNLNTYFEEIPAIGAFLAPQQLKSDSNSSFCGNLSFGGGGTLFYPFSSGVYPNAAVPGFGASASTTGTNAHTYKYNWATNTAGATLLYSDITSFASGTATLTALSTVLSGQFSTSSDVGGDYVTNPGSVFGGFAYNENPATAILPIRAVFGTSIDTDGSSSTYQSVFTESTSSTLSDALLIESTAAAYFAYQGPDGPAGMPVVAFPRNRT